MPALLNAEVREFANRSVLCWLATADGNGQPNVTPKEVFAIVDDDHLVIANISSPVSAKNIGVNPKVCASFIDVFVQKGFKVVGTASNVRPSAHDYSKWAAPLQAMVGDRFPIHSVFAIKADSVEKIVAPSYRLYPAETTEETQIQSALRTYGVTR
ncbi:pyridoxamine 5'-phosphate oxidase family protein [Caldimonas tepidiphila]|uniref:pyridoxamine 5'-phosphate oxidase family protein n=1 Tax=Caldimonas tepidiphila TaxID=2315841 RepID=UPI001F0BF18B|nr:pyridoxamine 5'-phosphate oxidase family protein [Caldimonas tepidiphila]